MLRRGLSIVVIAVSVGSLGPTVAHAGLGASGANLVYTPVAPCRIIDTRATGAGGRIMPGAPRDFLVNGTTGFEAQGGTAGGCGIPEGATAAMLNFVAVNPSGPGDLRAWPFGQAEPAASIINYAAVTGLNIANGLAVPLCDAATATCAFDMSVQADVNGTHLVVDVLGYLASTAPRGAVGAANTLLGINAGNFTMTGISNTATGANALSSNTTGNDNTATGRFALVGNTDGADNTATGALALSSNTAGGQNTATGSTALGSNTTGNQNTATGQGALTLNTTGDTNTAAGVNALLSNTTGGSNTAAGVNALFRSTGNSNIALGAAAGINLTTGNDNIYLGHAGVATESGVMRIGTAGAHTVTFIQGIAGAVANPATVLVDSVTGQLGTAVASSRRVKEDIREVGGEAGNRLLRLRPVTFRYRTPAADGSKSLQYGLVAEEVAAVVPELVVYDPAGEPAGVQYELLSVLLLAELQRQHRELQVLRAQVEAWGGGRRPGPARRWARGPDPRSRRQRSGGKARAECRVDPQPWALDAVDRDGPHVALARVRGPWGRWAAAPPAAGGVGSARALPLLPPAGPS